MQKRMTLHVNDGQYRIESDTARSLLNVLRNELSLTGSKYGCGEGQCGACTVLIDGRPRRSCITPVGAVAEKRIKTIESMEKNGQLHPLQEAFVEREAMQCGYCTAGMIMSGVALLEKNQNPSENEIVRSMNGNICRCGTYPRIVDAIRQAAEMMRGDAK
ncbi:MAG: (2Fe-2S)-binding protein [Candidatus Poribacteria bacterium]|jgi:aerobic-type carbon monoxide dehydrogenase small subunit (CoxS/CutS family)|nr:(2Fe-2S)-binding protein [Candidatus Poribacteria bacterium]MDP6996708.1 (2Fe-2S)-binding protein [Candidatus Poribacteria bacterium]